MFYKCLLNVVLIVFYMFHMVVIFSDRFSPFGTKASAKYILIACGSRPCYRDYPGVKDWNCVSQLKKQIQ